MSRKNDQFSDLLGMAHKSKSNNDRLPLSQRQPVGKSSPMASISNSWSGLDLLGGASTTSNSNSSNSSLFAVPSINGITSNLNQAKIDDPFDIFNGNSTPQPQQPSVYKSPPPAGIAPNLMDDDEFTDAFVPEPKPQIVDSPSNSQSPSLKESIPTRSRTNVFSQSPSDSSSSLPSVNTRTKQSKRDEVVAEIVDIGFPIEKANEAIDEVGVDLQKAVNFLMSQAMGGNSRPVSENRSTPTRRQPQQAPPANRNGKSQDELGQMVNELSSEFMSTASFLFTKGRKTLAKGIELYKDRQQAGDNKPTWMKSQDKYKSQSQYIDEDFDESEIDQDEVQRIIAQQKLKERERQRERLAQLTTKSNNDDRRIQTPEPPRRPITEDHTRPMSAPSSTRPVPPPSRVPQAQKPTQQTRPTQPEVDLFSPMPSRAQMFRKEAKEEEVYVSSSRRRPRATPTTSATPSVSSTPKLTRPVIPLDQFQSHDFEKFRNDGNDLFKKGDFANALANYQKSLVALPGDHDFKILTYSNLSQCHLRLGDAKSSLSEAESGLALLTDYTKYENWLIKDKPVKEFWLKLMTRKAESLEHLEKFKESLEAYILLVENGGTTKSVLDGKRRCQNVLNPPPQAAPKPKPAAKPSSSTARPTSSPSNSDILKRVQNHNAKEESFENEKFLLHDQIEARINGWKLGKEDNLRALLSSLDQVLWPGSGWKSVSIADLMLPKKVKIIYMKAVAKTHPDKIPQDATTQQKLVAQGIFVVLNQSWDKFKELNGLQ